MRKAAVVWIAPPAGRGIAARTIWHEGVAYAVRGPSEQPLPGPHAGDTAWVTARGDNGARSLTWEAVVSVVEPRSPEWETVVPLLSGARLNSTHRDVPAYWAEECEVLKFASTGHLPERGETLPTGSLAAAPPTSSATTPYRMPSKLGRRRPRP